MLGKKNKRHEADSLLISKKVIIIISWIVLFSIFILLAMAKPRIGTMFDRFYDTQIITGPWDKNSLKSIIYLIAPLGVLSVIGLYINSKRHGRKYDTYSKSLILALIISIIGIIIYYLTLYI